jgi:hypothetical protein
MYIHIYMKYNSNTCKNKPINTPKRRKQADRGRELGWNIQGMQDLQGSLYKMNNGEER